MESPNWLNPPHPLLPDIDRVYEAAEINAFGKDRGPVFYETCHRYAQSLWRLGYPAKCILLLNRALSCPLPGTEPVLRAWPLPYKAMAWLLIHRPADQFIGNPRRHWQHLATRMVPPHKDLRTWRAWACWYLAKEILPANEFPPDLQQIREEGVVEPAYAEIHSKLSALSPADDLARWEAALAWTRHQLGLAARSAAPARIRPIGKEELPVITDLAHRIWNVCYPGIISQAQIDYMLAVWYEPGAMARSMDQRHALFALIEIEDAGPVGYLSFEKYAGTDILFINKLYVLPEMHGRGLGAAALAWCAQQAQQQGCGRLQLRVNKANANAIRAYQRAGFHFVEDVCSDIGSGYVMDDYRMEKPLKS